MSEEGARFSAFVSHASEDIDAANELVRHLEERGYTCWVAPRDVRPGAEYGEEIIGGIRTSKCMILLLSDAANNSKFVGREVERAVSLGMPVFPLRLEDVPPSSKIELFISTVQWVDAWERNWQDVAEQMIGLLEGEYQPDPIRRKKHLNLTKAAAFGGVAVGLVAIIVAYASLTTKQKVTVEQITTSPAATTESQVNVMDLTRDDFRVRLFLYEEVVDRSIWTVSLQWSPRVAKVWNKLTDLYISHDGKTYRRSDYMADAIQVEGEGIRSSKQFYMKFKTWDGNEIGPFKYELDFENFAKEYSSKNSQSGTSAGDAVAQARKTLLETGASVSLDGLKNSITTADGPKLALLSAAGISGNDIKTAFSDVEIVRKFFDNSKNNASSIDWFRGIIGSTLDPNTTVPNVYYTKTGILQIALQAENLDAALALLDAGASPHVYQNLWFTWHRLPMSVFPFSYIDSLSGFTTEQKTQLAKSFAEAGAVFPSLNSSEKVPSALKKARNDIYEIEERYGVTIPIVASICEAKDTKICRSASQRSGFDWCAFSRKLPERIASADSDIYEFKEVELIQLVNVVEDRAIFLSKLFSGWRPGFGLVEVSKDQNTWTVYKYTPPGAGMGHCKKDKNGYVREDCWRRAVFKQARNPNVMTLMDYYSYEKTACP